MVHSLEARLVAVAQGLDTDERQGRLARTLIEVSGWERERLRERTHKGLQAARQNGRRAWQPVADDPELRPGYPAGDRRPLNEEGVPTVRGGAKWRPSSVQTAAGSSAGRGHGSSRCPARRGRAGGRASGVSPTDDDSTPRPAVGGGHVTARTRRARCDDAKPRQGPGRRWPSRSPIRNGGNVDGQRPHAAPEGLRIGRDMTLPQSLLDEWAPVPKRPLTPGILLRAAVGTVAPGVGDFFAEFVWERSGGEGPAADGGDPETRFVVPAGQVVRGGVLHSSDGPMSTGGPHQHSSSGVRAESHYPCREANLCGTTGFLRYGSWRASKTAAGAYIE